MSGGVSGPVGMVGAIGFAAIGAAAVIGATAMTAAEITRMGSIAAYEQIKIVGACTSAVKTAKEQRVQAVSSYRQNSQRTLSAINKSMGLEIMRLKTKLERKGYRIKLNELGADESEQLLKLIAMDQKAENVRVQPRLRIPAEIYRSITAFLDPLFTYIPERTSVYREMSDLKSSATALVTDSSKSATEKSMGLLELESRMIVHSEEYKAYAKRYEYYFSEFSSRLFANEKLSEALGCARTNLFYDPINARAQIELLDRTNEQLKIRLREKMKRDAAFVKANNELSQLVIKSVKEVGFPLVGVSEQEYGTSAVFSYRSSLIRTTVSREGMLSVDLVGRKDESLRQVKADESVFCRTDFERILDSFEKNGLFMQRNNIFNLTADSTLYEGDIEMEEYRENRWENADPLAMYADSPEGS